MVFYRAKTIITGKANLTPVTVYLTSFAKTVIERYGNPNQSPAQLVFPIIEEGQDHLASRGLPGNGGTGVRHYRCVFRDAIFWGTDLRNLSSGGCSHRHGR